MTACENLCAALDDIPEFAPDLEGAELDLVQQMTSNIGKAQQQAEQRRRWDPNSVDELEQYLRDTVQARK